MILVLLEGGGAVKPTRSPVLGEAASVPGRGRPNYEGLWAGLHGLGVPATCQGRGWSEAGAPQCGLFSTDSKTGGVAAPRPWGDYG